MESTADERQLGIMCSVAINWLLTIACEVFAVTAGVFRKPSACLGGRRHGSFFFQTHNISGIPTFCNIIFKRLNFCERNSGRSTGDSQVAIDNSSAELYNGLRTLLDSWSQSLYG